MIFTQNHVLNIHIYLQIKKPKNFFLFFQPRATYYRAIVFAVLRTHGIAIKQQFITDLFIRGVMVLMVVVCLKSFYTPTAVFSIPHNTIIKFTIIIVKHKIIILNNRNADGKSKNIIQFNKSVHY